MKFVFQTMFLAALLDLAWVLACDLWAFARRCVWGWRAKKLRARALRAVANARR